MPISRRRSGVALIGGVTALALAGTPAPAAVGSHTTAGTAGCSPTRPPWNGSSWLWTGPFRPAGTGAPSSAGIASGVHRDDGLHVFVRGTDGRLWQQRRTDHVSAWLSHGRSRVPGGRD